MGAGIDGAVASTHKVLAAITQSAVLNAQGPRIDAARLNTTVGMSQTTSPAAFILASIDAARSQMALHGRALLDNALALALDARERLRVIPGPIVVDGETLGVPRYDPTKFILDVAGMGISGFEAEHVLRNRFHINPEASDLVSVICFVTISDTRESIGRLVFAFEAMSRENAGRPPVTTNLRSSGSVIRPGIQAMTPRDAFFATSRAVPLRDAAGGSQHRSRDPLSAGHPGDRAGRRDRSAQARLPGPRRGGRLLHLCRRRPYPGYHQNRFDITQIREARLRARLSQCNPPLLRHQPRPWPPGVELAARFRRLPAPQPPLAQPNAVRRRSRASAIVSSFLAKQKRARSGAVAASR